MEFGKVDVNELDSIDFSLPKEPAFNIKMLKGKPTKHPKVYLGCAKWGRVEWVGKIYPAKTKEKDFHVSADLTGQANHLGVTIEADIIKQKLPENNGGYLALNTKESAYGKNDARIYSELTSDHPIDLCRYQVANCYMGRAGLINSGGASSGASDMAEAVTTAVINKRAGGMGLISGRKAFQRPMKEGAEILNAIQDVYLDNDITIA